MANSNHPYNDLDMSYYEQQIAEILDRRNPTYTASIARMPEHSTGIITGETTGIAPLRTGVINNYYTNNRPVYAVAADEYTSGISFNSIDTRMHYTISNQGVLSSGYFKIPNKNMNLRLEVTARPTQETLDELYDLFKWTYHDN